LILDERLLISFVMPEARSNLGNKIIQIPMQPKTKYLIVSGLAVAAVALTLMSMAANKTPGQKTGDDTYMPQRTSQTPSAPAGTPEAAVNEMIDDALEENAYIESSDESSAIISSDASELETFGQSTSGYEF
jgi:hypothetical protein